MDHIPIVDFGKYALTEDEAEEDEKNNIGEAVYEALAKAGFVYLANTGVAEPELDEIKKITRKFFDLDVSSKEKYMIKEELCGYIGNEHERLNSKRPADLKETYDMNSHVMASEFTKWPDDEVPGFSTVMKNFADTCKKLCMRILEVVAIGMDIKDRDLFMRSHMGMKHRNNYSCLRSVLYRPLPEWLEIKTDQVRLGEHTDYGSLTLVFQDDVGGLQVEKYDGTYIDATPIPGTVLVNIGDCLEYWTRGKLKAPKHRILIPTDEKRRRSERMSVVYFAKPNNDTMMSEVEYGAKHLSHRTPFSSDQFQPMTAGEYIGKTLDRYCLLSA